jgi:hypothetical protein
MATNTIESRLLLFYFISLLLGFATGWAIQRLAQLKLRYRTGTSQASYADGARGYAWLALSAGAFVALLFATLAVWFTNWVEVTSGDMLAYMFFTMRFWAVVLAGATGALFAYVVTSTVIDWGGSYAFLPRARRS